MKAMVDVGFHFVSGMFYNPLKEFGLGAEEIGNGSRQLARQTQ